MFYIFGRGTDNHHDWFDNKKKKDDVICIVEMTNTKTWLLITDNNGAAKDLKDTVDEWMKLNKIKFPLMKKKNFYLN